MSTADVIHGSYKIINPINVKPGINIEQIEEDLVSGGTSTEVVKDPGQAFEKELSGYMKELGISFDDYKRGKKEVPGHISEQLRQERERYDKARQSHHEDKSDDKSGLSFYEKQREAHRDDENSDKSDDDSEGQDDSVLSKFGHSEPDQYDRFNQQDRYEDKRSETVSSFQSEVNRKTDEQRRQETINSVMSGMDSGSASIFSIEREKIEDTKSTMLEEIDSLRNSLEEDEIDIKRVPVVTQASSYEEIENVLKILRLKNDRMRYCSFAEEFLLCGAHGLEELFNGKRVWLNRYRPDLTGWHTQVNTKLRRMRHDTSTLVSGIMHDYNIGPGMRILLELFPNMFMYSKMRKQQFGSDNLYSDDEIAQHINNIRNVETRQE